MLVARFRLAAPLSSLGVIVASMGQPNGGPEGRRARGKIFDSARRSRQSTSKTATDASVRIMSLKPSSPPMPLLPPKGARGRSAWSGSSRRCIRRHFQVRHWLHALRRGVRADTLRVSRDSGRPTRARTLGASTVAHRLGTLSGSRSIGNTRSRETYPAGRSGPFGIRGEDHFTPSSFSPAQRSGA